MLKKTGSETSLLAHTLWTASQFDKRFNYVAAYVQVTFSIRSLVIKASDCTSEPSVHNKIQSKKMLPLTSACPSMP